MDIYSKPIAFAVLAVVVILVGTVVTMFIPLFMPATQPPGDFVKPYTAVELEGRDIYIREGCNNCHTQTVRPLRTEVARYGEYSKPQEFAYDRPFLWGSRRTGPDLNRVGGKYPDSWHYQHMDNPQAMFQQSNMPAYRWLAQARLDTSYTAKKVAALGYGYSPQDVQRQLDDFRARVTAVDYPSKEIRNKVTPGALKGDLTELDALVAYLQKLGKDVKTVAAEASAPKAAEAAAALKNPYEGNRESIEEGKKLFAENCSVCHGADAKGKLGPDLTTKKKKFGDTDGDLYASIAKGRPGGMPDWEKTLGSEKIWKVIAYLRGIEGKQ
ncbi:MAG: cytochrome-c oxidase, cbb3-type subunit II [Nitrospirae bacterium]|nr:cytochrome-c oxidase, cbb3-type subunit II [Nitrospirota bacterium]